MTSFGWKRKAGAGVIRKASQAFEEEAKDEELDNEVTRGEVDWLTLAPKKRLISLEDARAKSRRLSDEASTLAEAERYWEAIKKWDEALLIAPSDSQMLEMKAQALMAVGEVFPAVQTAQQAVNADPTWWVARQTLGRAQLNLGEVKLAIRSFSKAVLLNPAERELWEEDLQWACSVRDRSKTVTSFSVTSKASGLLSSSESGTAHKADATSSESEGRCSTVVQTRNTADISEDSENDRAHDDHADESRDAEENDARRTVLNVPLNYVHLRG
ncbi:tetratricopeptide repeat protein 33-like isoform X2 [Babylonia areolata]